MSIVDEPQTDPAVELTDVALTDLQLRHQPFAAQPASGETFLDNIAEAQLDDIKQALISGDDLLLVLGPDGSGKSTLLNQLGANSGQRIQCFSVRGSERFSTTNLFAGMLEAFKKQPPGDLKLMLDDLIPSLQGMTDHNTLGAVVVDDAQNIPESELTKLLSGMLYLNSSDETLLRVTLAAPTEFEERIPELLPEGADLPYSSLAIDAFDKDRSAAYLDFRLQQAGLTGEFPFDDNEIAEINEEAGGRPGLLHAVAAQHLNLRDENYVAELPPELAGGKSKKAAGGGLFGKFGGTKLLVGAAALAMIFAGLFWLKPDTVNVPDDRYKVVESKKLDTTSDDAAKKAAELQALNEQKAAEKLAAAQAQEQQSDTASDTDAAAALPTDSANNEANTDASADIAEDAAAKAEAQLQAKLERDAAEKAAQEKLEKEKLEKEKAEQARLAAEKAAKEQAEKEEAAKKQAEADAAAKKAAEAQAANSASLSNLESPNWILVQNASLFTVQMSASTDRNSVEAFLARNQLEAPNSIFSFNRNGATWFALVHGLYNSIEEARLDIEKMPASARSNQPWIRAVGRIQNALKEQ